MATRFDSFTRDECSILGSSLSVYRDSYLALTRGLVNGAAPSRDALLVELQGATNWAGKSIDVEAVGKNPRRQ